MYISLELEDDGSMVERRDRSMKGGRSFLQGGSLGKKPGSDDACDEGKHCCVTGIKLQQSSSSGGSNGSSGSSGSSGSDGSGNSCALGDAQSTGREATRDDGDGWPSRNRVGRSRN